MMQQVISTDYNNNAFECERKGNEDRITFIALRQPTRGAI